MLVTVQTFRHNQFDGWQPDSPPKPIDWNNSSDRKWLQSHMHWAMCNGKQVRLNPPVGDSHNAD